MNNPNFFPGAGAPAPAAGFLQRDPELERFIHRAIRQAESEMSLPRLPEVSSEEAQAQARENMYCVAVSLCDAGNFMQAAPLAMSLAINSPYDPRFYFVTGRAFQRLGVFNVAQTFYEHSMREGRSALAMYRLAECLAGQGKGQEAIRHFEYAYTLGRQSGDYRALQDSAMDAIERVRSQSMKKGPST